MKVEKQLIERNLKFSNTYVYLGLTRGSIESAQMCTCDNCGKLITNMVSIADNKTGVKYTIGTDCSDTLIKANCVTNGLNRDYHMDVYEFNQVSKFVTELNKGKEYENLGFQLKVKTDKGKDITVFTHSLQKYYPTFIK